MIKQAFRVICIISTMFIQTVSASHAPQTNMSKSSHQNISQNSDIPSRLQSCKRKAETPINFYEQAPEEDFILHEIPVIIDNTELKMMIRTKSHFNHDLVNRMLQGISLPSITQIIVTAGNEAQKRGNHFITEENINSARKTILIGNQSRSQQNQKNLYVTSLHESGHAVVASILHMYKNSPFVVDCVSVKPHEKALGIVICNQIDEKRITRTDLFHGICINFAGGITEQMHSNVIDCAHCKSNIAQAKIQHIHSAFIHFIKAKNTGWEDDKQKAIYDAKKLAQTLNAIRKNHIKTELILFLAYMESCNILLHNLDAVQKSADALMAHGHISGDDFFDITGLDRPVYDFEEGPLPENSVSNYERRCIKKPNKTIKKIIKQYDLLMDTYEKNQEQICYPRMHEPS